MDEKSYLEMTYKETLDECDHLVKLSLTEAEARWLLERLDEAFPRRKETNHGVARSGTHLCNPADICVLAGFFARDWKKRRGAARSASYKLLCIAEHEWSKADSHKIRLV